MGVEILSFKMIARRRSRHDMKGYWRFLSLSGLHPYTGNEGAARLWEICRPLRQAQARGRGKFNLWL